MIALQYARFGEPYVIFGALGAAALRLDPGTFIFNEVTARGFWMTAWLTRASAERRGRQGKVLQAPAV